MKRRRFLRDSSLTLAAGVLATENFLRQAAADEAVVDAKEGWSLNYLLGSCMYGYLYLGEILSEVRKTGANAIDIWPKVHGNQREQPLAIALAPYHLPQQPEMLADLIRALGDRIRVFYAWQHGMGCMTRLPKEQELLQMPGRGELDFKPIVAALKEIDYQGWTEIFMHPVPRGVSILETPAEITAEINRSRDYLEKCVG